jgi:hypothetical protein
MTQEDIEKKFTEAVNSKELKQLDITKSNRYDLKHRTSSIAKKLELLWKLGKLELKK